MMGGCLTGCSGLILEMRGATLTIAQMQEGKKLLDNPDVKKLAVIDFNEVLAVAWDAGSALLAMTANPLSAVIDWIAVDLLRGIFARPSTSGDTYNRSSEGPAW